MTTVLNKDMTPNKDFFQGYFNDNIDSIEHEGDVLLPNYKLDKKQKEIPNYVCAACVCKLGDKWGVFPKEKTIIVSDGKTEKEDKFLNVYKVYKVGLNGSN